MQQIQDQLEDLKCRIEEHAAKSSAQFEDLHKKLEAVNTALLGSLDGRTGLIASERHAQKSLDAGRTRMDGLDVRMKAIETREQYRLGWSAGVAAVISVAVTLVIAFTKYLMSSAK